MSKILKNTIPFKQVRASQPQTPVGDIFINEVAKATGSSAQSFAFANTYIGGYGTHQLTCPLILERTISDVEIKSPSQNPWQIFTPLNKQAWVTT